MINAFEILIFFKRLQGTAMQFTTIKDDDASYFKPIPATRKAFWPRGRMKNRFLFVFVTVPYSSPSKSIIDSQNNINITAKKKSNTGQRDRINYSSNTRLMRATVDQG